MTAPVPTQPETQSTPQSETQSTPRSETRPGLETVLVAVSSADGDRIGRLVDETVDIAGPSGATVVLTHVFTPEEFDERVDALRFDLESRDVSPRDVAVRHSLVREFGGRLEANGLDYEIHGSVGTRGAGISSLAERLDADLVIVGGRRRSPTGKAVFGSVAQAVMLSAPCPVTFVRADTR